MVESSGYLALRWNNHPNLFSTVLDDLRRDESYCDVSLSCGGQFYPAHKFMLATCSNYFKEMFARTPCKHPIIFLNNVSPIDLEAILDFMYKGEIHVAETQVTSLLCTAEGLRIKGLAVPDTSHLPPSTSAVPPPPPLQTPVNASQATTPASFMPSPATKRMRSADGSPRKDEPPKLTPLPKGGAPHLFQFPSTSGLQSDARFSSPPELKRFKHNTPTSAGNRSLNFSSLSSSARQFNGQDSEPPSRASSCVDSQDGFLPNGIGSDLMKKASDGAGNNDSEDRSTCSSEDGSATSIVKGVAGDESSWQLPASGFIKEEPFQNNGNMDNEEDTNEVLQVDLSEDGTQFIIGPGGRMSADRDEPPEDDPADGQKKPFVCPLCGHDFTRRDNLANHLKTHTGDRPYMCQYCYKCFSRKDYLKQHERIHTGEKPYQCPQCTRAFTRKEGMTDHMRCHSDHKEFTCEVCSKSFKQKCGLRFHKRNYKH